jgi:hypothetical protein
MNPTFTVVAFPRINSLLKCLEEAYSFGKDPTGF